MDEESREQEQRQTAKARGRRRVMIVLGVLVVAALAINAPGLTALGYLVRYQRIVDSLPAAAPFTAADRLLVIAPHPDDETLACAGSILAAKRAGAKVCIVWLTSGDGFEWDEVVASPGRAPTHDQMLSLGYRRMDEARAAAELLEVPPESQVFLGYPDGGLSRLPAEPGEPAYRSRYTGVSAVPYTDAYAPGAPYTRDGLEQELGKLLDSFDPTLALVPSVKDHHPDHRAAAALVEEVFSARGWGGRLRYYIVHGGMEWPMPKGLHLHPQLPLVPSPRGHKLDWQRVDLSSADFEIKLAAIKAHRSQLEVLARFLFAFARTNELIADEDAEQ